MYAPKLIATDMDGTILFNWAQELSPRTLGLVRRVIDAGIVFVPASGRQYANLRTIFSPMADRLAYVADNGAMALVNNEVVYRATMDKALGDRIVRELLLHPECEPLVSGARTSYIRAGADEFYEHMTQVMRFSITAVDDVTSDATGEPYSKISAHYAGSDLTPERFAFWQERFDGQCAVVTSGLTWLDFMPFGVDKARGLAAVCERLGIDPLDCMAFGDAGNDLEMLDFVGCPIAVRGATPEARAHARFVVDTVEQALTRILDGPGFDW